MTFIRRPLGILARGFLRLVPRERVAAALGGFAAYYARALPPAEGLRFLFDLDRRVYRVEGRLAIQYGGGEHTKHRHLRYHDFFTERIQATDRVLDIGCGGGALAHDVAVQTGATVYGIDINEKSIRTARHRYNHPGVTFIAGDALRDLPDGEHFTVIILSNVLEHIDDRVGLLRSVVARYQPERILIRVPAYDRDWRIPLQDELGSDYRLDPTHFIEFRQPVFREEMTAAGLVIDEMIPVWGELWCRLHPVQAEQA